MHLRHLDCSSDGLPPDLPLAIETGADRRTHQDPPWTREWPATTAAGSRRKSLRKDEMLFLQGAASTGLHWLVKGKIGLRCVDEFGNERLAQIVNPGELLVTVSDRHLVAAQALTRCEMRCLDARSARQWIGRNAAAADGVAAQIARDLRLSLEMQMLLAHRSVMERICWALDRLAEAPGTADVIDLPMSRQDFASWIGARPETLSRGIRELQTRGIAEFSERRVVVDRDALDRERWSGAR